MESIYFAANMCKYQFICTLEIWRALDVMENQHLILGCMMLPLLTWICSRSCYTPCSIKCYHTKMLTYAWGLKRRQSNSCFFSLTRSLFYTFDHNAIWATHSITCFRDARSDVNGNGCKAYILNTYAYTHIHLILICIFCKNYS